VGFDKLCDAMAEEELPDPKPLTKEEAERVKERLLEKVESWEQKEAERKAKPKPKHVN
jgi:hypothetical protein